MEAEERRAQFEVVAREVLEPVRRYLARRTDPTTAEDVLGETLLVLWRRLDDLPSSPGETLPWTYAVARRCLANAERSARRQRRVAGRVAALDPPATQAPGADVLAGADAEPALHAALATLPHGDAELLRLWAWEGLEPAAIATVLGVGAGTVRSRLHRARRRLAAALGDAAGGAGHGGSGGGDR